MAQASVLKEFQPEDLRDVALTRSGVGACLKGRVRGAELSVVIKLYNPTAESCDCLVQVKNALSLSQVFSEQIMVPLGLIKSRSLLGFVWNWMSEGSLHSLLYETHLYLDLHMALRLQILLDVAEGLKHLHAIPLPHGALKATNILLDQQYRAKLCDWGQQTVLRVRTSMSSGDSPCLRDLAYMSPEVIHGGVPSVEADMFSFGVLMWEALNRKRPCEVMDHLQILLLSAQDGVEPGLEVKLLPSETPQCHALTQLMIRCLSSEPNLRPKADECIVELKKALATFDSEEFTTAARKLIACKKALLCGKNPTAWELPIELNNLEGCSGSMSQKKMSHKTIPQNLHCSNKPAQQRSKSAENSPRGSPPFSSTASPSPPTVCCRDTSNNNGFSMGPSSNPGFRQCGVAYGINRPQTPAPPNTPCVSPTSAVQAPLQHPSLTNQTPCQGSAGWSCCRLLQEKREAIVHCMTEGRFNNLLDVLRARQAVTREAYELITAAITLTARTRCLLDVCACLGENVAILVASTLGLVSTHNQARTQTASKGQAG
ncbi:receptor-interacting serine/threonine-protein kinase 2 isoform X2 [Hoplias malabaricus]|uniref:receptor-interacting serine/threonine-protein kinase 2 isoform X2 n=1 Tax=Hoplias malabaricus TaxID=27720 RepID=UPI003463837F